MMHHFGLVARAFLDFVQNVTKFLDHAIGALPRSLKFKGESFLSNRVVEPHGIPHGVLCEISISVIIILHSIATYLNIYPSQIVRLYQLCLSSS